ncbi:Circadian clock protein KaiB [bioreactor metagenome]|uniref:Circadian clock protein KaiB n=1 Tax=bioreactor metagenome TaxID=1076179 RepID=A0A645AJX3_9ZZZZ
MDELANVDYDYDQAATDPVNKYVLQLYIAGSTPRSQRAVINVQKICRESLTNFYELQVIDIFQQPFLAKAEQIFAVPTLIKKLPIPKRLFIGDMSDTETILASLE